MPVEYVCELGSNVKFLAAARGSSKTGSVVDAPGPVMAGKTGWVKVTASCKYPYLSVLSMIAPSPDWIVQLANIPLLNAYGHYIQMRSGPLLAYDCGTDSGSEFTAPPDTSLDIPTEPPMNIAPLYTDKTDPFGRKSVGWYVVKRMM